MNSNMRTIEKDNKRRKILFILLGVLIFCIVVAAVAFAVWKLTQETEIVVVASEKILISKL